MKRPSLEFWRLVGALTKLLCQSAAVVGFVWTAITWDWNYTLVFGFALAVTLVHDVADKVCAAIREHERLPLTMVIETEASKRATESAPLTTHVQLGSVWIQRDIDQIEVPFDELLPLVRNLLVHLDALSDAR